MSAALAKSLVGITPPRYPSALLEALIKPSTRYHDLAVRWRLRCAPTRA